MENLTHIKYNTHILQQEACKLHFNIKLVIMSTSTFNVIDTLITGEWLVLITIAT